MTGLSLTAAHWQSENVPACHSGDPLLLVILSDPPLVILSAAKDLVAHRARSFAALRMTLSGCPENNLTK